MSFSPEEIRKSDEESSKLFIEWYCAYLALSSQEQKRQSEIRDRELSEELAQFRVWINSEERRQFDIKYAEHEAAKFLTT